MGINTNGLNILSKTYQDNDSYKDEWYLVYEPISLDLTAVYDPHSIRSTSYYVTNLQSAIQGFLTNFGVQFNYCGISEDSALTPDYTNCSCETISDVCDSSCGDIALCSSLHHRSAARINAIDLSTTYSSYICRFVGFSICAYNSEDDSHGGVNGLADINGKNVTVSGESDDIERTIQHELSHTLGACDGECTSGEYCVMSGKVNYWCTNCRNRIFYANAYLER